MGLWAAEHAPILAAVIPVLLLSCSAQDLFERGTLRSHATPSDRQKDGLEEVLKSQEELRPLGSAVCGTGEPESSSSSSACPIVHLGNGVRDVRVEVAELCDQRDARGLGYICNTTLTPACAAICRGVSAAGGRHFLQKYIDAILGVNQFRGPSGESLEPWEVPQTDLSAEGAYIFMSQRQGLYLYLRTLGLKIRFPNRTVVSNETSRVLPGTDETIINALEYGLTYGCNWRPSNFYIEPEACSSGVMWSGVSREGIQGNIFGLLAWLRQVAVESGAGSNERTACYAQQLTEENENRAGRWCPHDSVLGAVRGGRSGPDARDELDNPTFWKSRPGNLRDAGGYPNVCHFESSTWVWNNTLDKVSPDEKRIYCKGASKVPDVYADDIGDFMSIDNPGTLAVDIGGAQYGGGVGSTSGKVYSTQDESTPVFYPEAAALSFNSRNRSISTGKTVLVFLGVRRYFTGQSGSHGYDYEGLETPLFNHGDACGNLQEAKLMAQDRMLKANVATVIGGSGDAKRNGRMVIMYKHSMGVLTSSCGTCADGNLPTNNQKYKTNGSTCLVTWSDGRSGCGDMPEGGWTYWMDVWIWVGALYPDFYPSAARSAFRDLVGRIGTGPWGAGVWWGNTLQYFIVTWLATSLLWDQSGTGPQLDYYAYGAPGQHPYPIGGFCEAYQAQGYEDVVKRLPQIDAALRARPAAQPATLQDLYSWLSQCSRCSSSCTFVGVGPPPSSVYCTTPCTDDFLSCFVAAIGQH